MARQHTSMFLCILALTPMALAMPFAMDMYIATLPHIMVQLHVSEATIQLTLNLFLVFSGISLLLTGPISDSLGRHKSAALYIFILTVGCVMDAMAHSFSWLLAGRFIQAIGSCGLNVVCLSIARDLYDGNPLAKAFSIINGIIAMSPLLAPSIGSAIDIAYGWHAVFWALLSISILTIVCYYPFLPETLPLEKRRPIPKDLFQAYVTLFKNPMFSLYSLFSASGIAGLFLFCALSPGVLMHTLHVSERAYAIYFAISGISIFSGSLVCANLVERIGIYRMTKLGCYITITGALIMGIWYAIYGPTVLGFIAPMLLIGLGGTVLIGSGAAGSVHPYGEQAGTANAGGSAARLFFCGVIGLIIARYANSPVPLFVSSFALCSLSLILSIAFKRRLQISSS